jgi:hypothetical protein
MQFIYVLVGWEGFAADGRVLRDAINRRNGLRVPHGKENIFANLIILLIIICTEAKFFLIKNIYIGYYYLVDAGYTNCKSFLAPYREQRYHLNDWRVGHQPTTAEEFFNMKHSSARNIIERCFGLLKLRWAILRSPSFYPIKTHNQIIMACCLLHNYVRREMLVDPLEEELD